MLYHSALYLQHFFHGFNVFHYVSVRASGALLTALFFSFVGGYWFIEESKKRFRAKVRDHTPERHLEKNDTPTMGGMFILMIFVINTLLWNNLLQVSVWIFMFCMLSFGGIGFLDDWAKISRRKGIPARSKAGLQLLCAFLVMVMWYLYDASTTSMCVPFFKRFMPELGWLVIPWGMFVIHATSNAVNLTDGLDGLATGPLIFNFSTFGLIAYLAGHKYFAYYLQIPYTLSSELAIIAATLVGCLLGFLWYNTYPAQIFMGDIGSLALGAGLAFLTIAVRQELLLPLAGGIFVMETVSVIMQVISYRYLGRRVFRMAPIHHHFELLGWNEAKITIRFWIISLILSVLALLTLKIR